MRPTKSTALNSKGLSTSNSLNDRSGAPKSKAPAKASSRKKRSTHRVFVKNDPSKIRSKPQGNSKASWSEALKEATKHIALPNELEVRKSLPKIVDNLSRCFLKHEHGYRAHQYRIIAAGCAIAAHVPRSGTGWHQFRNLPIWAKKKLDRPGVFAGDQALKFVLIALCQNAKRANKWYLAVGPWMESGEVSPELLPNAIKKAGGIEKLVAKNREDERYPAGAKPKRKMEPDAELQPSDPRNTVPAGGLRPPSVNEQHKHPTGDSPPRMIKAALEGLGLGLSSLPTGTEANLCIRLDGFDKAVMLITVFDCKRTA